MHPSLNSCTLADTRIHRNADHQVADPKVDDGFAATPSNLRTLP